MNREVSQNVLITGITGMDGSLLADLLLAKGYRVFGLIRHSANPNHWRIEHIIKNPNLHLIEGDITDLESVHRAIENAQPTCIYNLAAQSFVPYSWSAPISTLQITGLGAVNILESIRSSKMPIKFYQASSSEMFGRVLETPQTELTSFYPRSPYGIAKTTAHYATVNYRESFGIHATSGILFNHEHERRGEYFVTRKITKGVAQFFMNFMNGLPTKPIYLGNLEARRDWGYAEDYVKAMVDVINYHTPDTFVIATGVTRSVREFCETAVEMAIKKTGARSGGVDWRGCAENEIGYYNGIPVFAISKEFYRPAEVDLLLGDPSKAERLLGWKPETSFQEMVYRMVSYDLDKNEGSLN